MGVPGAYLEVARREHDVRQAPATLSDYDEIALSPDEAISREQASRCMNCGVGFCQTGVSFDGGRPVGCPLHNLIPEWNDLVCRGLWSAAAERLALTNPFPEFTGRVCPAPCELACNLGVHDMPTTIRDNERAIADHAFADGRLDRVPSCVTPPAAGAASVTVVGTGPAGLACAWELARRGVRVRMLERDDRAGGLLTYGIPNMKLPKDVVMRRLDLMRAMGIEIACGVDASSASVAQEVLFSSDAVVVAAGARRARRLAVAGADLEGVVEAVDYLGEATASLLEGRESAFTAAGREVVVVGGGDTGADCVATALRQGATRVTQLEFLPRPFAKPTHAWPAWSTARADDYATVEATCAQGADPRRFGVETLEVLGTDGRVTGLRVCSLDWTDSTPRRVEGTARVIDATLVLIAMGFEGPEPALFDAFGIAHGDDARQLPLTVAGTHEAFVDHGATGRASRAVPTFVCGDCRGGASLVASAIADGLAAAREVARRVGV